MAVKEMRRIGDEVRERWPEVERVGIIHRFGPLEISESSVVILVTSPHRRVAFEACRYAIDRLKQTVPIWKKEIFDDGEEWVEGQAPDKNQ
jgi:molybdopterin synthase catalytic subunit